MKGRRAIQASAVLMAVVLALLWAFVITAAGAREGAQPGTSAGTIEPGSAFGDYWFAGKAEINRYDLEQARYGETHRGHAVLIFVTEDFLPEKQVKADSMDRAATGAWPVLKVNFTKKFDTGVYPYSIMTSVFTPIDVLAHPQTLKATTSVQEWCGHVFAQLNLRGKRYEGHSFSYFESEGDQTFRLDAPWLEDGIWTRLRLDPASLPLGKVKMIPGLEQSRILHRPFAVIDAETSLEEEKAGRRRYTIAYPAVGRRLTIEFAAAFPHRIEGWEETVESGGKTATTRATRTHTEMLDYWKHNKTEDAPLRAKLGLE